MKRNDEKLSDFLKRWDVSDEVPRAFRSSVWSQIGARQDARDQSFWNRAARLVAGYFAKPVYAAATAAVALTLSIGAAHLHAGSVVDGRLESAKSDYLASINPLVMISSDGQNLER